MALYLTRGINDTVAEKTKFAKEVMSYIRRYFRGDWGDLLNADKQLNIDALKSNHGRLFAAYLSSEGKVYIITDDVAAEKKVTTVLFASEY